MVKTTHHITLFAVVYSIIFTMMTYINPQYKEMWLNLSLITTPIIYALGYGILMDRQKEEFSSRINDMEQETIRITQYAIQLEVENRKVEKQAK